MLERMLRRYIPEQKQIIVEEEETDVPKAVQKPEKEKMEKTDVKVVKSVTREEEDSSSALDTKGITKLIRAGINVDQGISYCGDREGFREILSIYHKEGANRKRQLLSCFEQEDWKNYVINVHALKSNSKGVGANELSEMALNLEMAGKENRIDYILQHHEELVQTHDELLQILENNEFLYPEGEQQPEETVEQDDTDESLSEDEPTGDEVTEQSLTEVLAALEEKLSEFESEGLEDILKSLANCQCQDVPLTELAEQIREKTNEFDFLGAAELLESWRDRLPSDS
ncbi:MAG: Hpt domain-containing protein [Lachnospiraceae bacterium]|nr:Hpt domain-containing protein [Lachnospiraceae bacterium]